MPKPGAGIVQWVWRVRTKLIVWTIRKYNPEELSYDQAFRRRAPRQKTVTIELVGLEDDFEIAKRIFLYAYDCAISAIKHDVKKDPLDLPGTYREQCNAYGWGFVDGVDAAFREQEEKHKDWGLALVVPQAVTDSMKGMGKKSTFGQDKNNHANCKAAGFQAGRKFDPTHRVAGKSDRVAMEAAQ